MLFLRALIPGQKLNNKDKMKSNKKKRQKSITPTSQELGRKGVIGTYLGMSQLNDGFPPSGEPNCSSSSSHGFFVDCGDQASELTAPVTTTLPCTAQTFSKVTSEPLPSLALCSPCSLHLLLSHSGSGDPGSSFPYGTEFCFILFLLPISRYSGRLFYDDIHSQH